MKKILILNHGPGLGDFIYKAFIIMFYLKIEYNHKLFYYELYKNNKYIKFYKKYFNDIFTYVDSNNIPEVNPRCAPR